MVYLIFLFVDVKSEFTPQEKLFLCCDSDFATKMEEAYNFATHDKNMILLRLFHCVFVNLLHDHMR